MFRSRKLQVGLLLVAFSGLALWLRPASDSAVGAPEMKLVEPAELVTELSDANRDEPTIVYVGFANLYRGGHIPGAVFHGSAGSPDGLRSLKAWAQKLSRKQRIVIYCGCCPWDRCPNVRPAHKALHEMGFEQLRVLHIPTDLGADWVRKGYPIEK